MTDDLRTRIAAALAAEFDGQARKFDDAGWEGVADAVIAELGLRREAYRPGQRSGVTATTPTTAMRRYVTEWVPDE